MGAYNDEVAFVHIPKCGGWTAKTYMAEHLPNFLMPQKEDGTVHEDNPTGFPLGHVRLADFERFTGRPPDSWDRIVALIRNPYEQQLSQWLFWLNRWQRGANHFHDYIASQYSRLEEFLLDPRCDFHVWYDHHYGGTEAPHREVPLAAPGVMGHTYHDFGGIYHYFLAVDGRIPDNVEVVKLEEVDTELPKVVQPYVDHDLPAPPKKNSTPWRGHWPSYYTPTAINIVNRKARWAFSWHYQMVEMDEEEAE